MVYVGGKVNTFAKIEGTCCVHPRGAASFRRSISSRIWYSFLVLLSMKLFGFDWNGRIAFSPFGRPSNQKRRPEGNESNKQTKPLLALLSLFITAAAY